jgi:hypothetical protein
LFCVYCNEMSDVGGGGGLQIWVIDWLLWDGLILQVPDAEDEQAIVVPPGLGNGGKRVHPLPYLESNLPGMDYSYFLLLPSSTPGVDFSSC